MRAEAIDVAWLPMPLSWLRQPAASSIEDEALTITAGPRTDWFADPAGGAPLLNAPALLGRPPDGEFTLAARVRVEAAAMFDAGVLFVHADDETWAKLCLERSPQGKPTIVSVVTRGVSDDCNSETIETSEAWLRLARRGKELAFHASADGRRWELIRHFALPADSLDVGFVAQSPAGSGCSATFTEIAYERRRLADLRDGS
jgi:uncharacterized protein